MRYLSLVLFLIFCKNVCSAQFYDDEDEIYFYADEKDVDAFVFNFDGKRAISLPQVQTFISVKQALERDAYYFEKRVFSIDYNMRYDESKSTSTTTVYVRRVSLPHLPTFMYVYVFSNDRETMDYYNGDGYRCTCRRVDKSYFMPGRKRKNLNDDTLYE